MKPRYWTAGMITGGVSAAAFALAWLDAPPAMPPNLARQTLWEPAPPALPVWTVTPAPELASAVSDPDPRLASPERPAMLASDEPVAQITPPVAVWSREIETGDTLDGILAEAGLTAADRAEIALALGAQFDLRRLRPGHRINVVSTPGGTPQRVALNVDEGVIIEAIFGEQLETRVLTPKPEIVTLAGQARIKSTIFTALEDAGMPARFAVDLAQMLGGTVDFRQDLSGGETLRFMWRESRIGGELVGQPELTFAALDVGGSLYEVVWPDDGTGRATIYLDGRVVRVFSQPVEGARLSSVFGRRVHPVYGNVRMHTGVDFAAAKGSPVRATAPGRIAFIGRRGGYGRVVEIAHGSDTMSRYAHLSAVPDGLAKGQRVAAGDIIGRVGATGTATGPNLHYEVRVNGRPTDPLSDDRLAKAAKSEAREGLALERLTQARARLEDALDSKIADRSTKRL